MAQLTKNATCVKSHTALNIWFENTPEEPTQGGSKITLRKERKHDSQKFAEPTHREQNEWPKDTLKNRFGLYTPLRKSYNMKMLQFKS